MAILSALTNVPSPLLEKNWTSLGPPNSFGTQYYIDESSIKPNKQLHSALILEDRKYPSSITLKGKNIIYKSYMHLNIIDCTHRRSAKVKGIFYSGNKTQGVRLFSYSERLSDDIFTDTKPGSWGEAIIEYVCAGIKPLKLTT